MENLVYVMQLLKRYDGFYFIKKSLCKNIYRKLLGIFVALIFSFTLIAAFFEKFYIFFILISLFFLLLTGIFELIDKDHKDFINQPLSMKLLKYNYLILRTHAIKDTLQNENLYNKNFLNKTIKECDTYLILEPNTTSFILKHPLIIIPISIISSYLSNLLWANNGPNAIMIIAVLLIILFNISPYFEDKCARVRTVKFILQTLQNQMRYVQAPSFTVAKT